MKVTKYIYSLVALMTMMLVIGCTPDSYDMGGNSLTKADLAQGTGFTITPDAANPNLIHLKSLLPNYNAFWSHPGVGKGHSDGTSVDLKIAFAGEYTVVYGVSTRAGIVYSDPVTIQVNSFCADFVSGEAWQQLAGGAGGSKTWVLDNGKCGMKQGAYSCFDPNASFEDMTHDEGLNNWYANGYTWWEPANTDIGITEADLAKEMTFGLSGGATLTIKNADGSISEGSFAFDPDNHSISAIGVEFVHGDWADGKSKSFSDNFYVFHLDENQLMIANKRDPALSGEGECWYVWNFVSKEYRDNYNVEETHKVTLPDDFMDYILPMNQRETKYKFDGEEPFAWFDLDGKPITRDLKNFPPAANIESAGMTLYYNTKDGKSEVTFIDPQENEHKSTFKLSDNGIFSFAEMPIYAVSTNTDIKFDSKQNELQILGYEVDDYSGDITDLWLGSMQYDAQGKPIEYLGYHLKKQTGGQQVERYVGSLSFFDTGWAFLPNATVTINGEGTYTFTLTPDGVANTSSPYGIFLDIPKLYKNHNNCDVVVKSIKVDGKEIAFDDTLIDRGTADGDLSTARRYIVNPWGKTADDAPKYAFTATLEITVQIIYDCGSNVMNPAE